MYIQIERYSLTLHIDKAKYNNEKILVDFNMHFCIHFVP